MKSFGFGRVLAKLINDRLVTVQGLTLNSFGAVGANAGGLYPT
jgi:hypothetical protein